MIRKGWWVLLALGREVPISKLRAGMNLATTGPGHRRSLARSVLATYHHRSSDLYRLQIGHEHLVTTGGHRFWVSHHGFINARNLVRGEELLRPGGRTITLRSIRRLHATRTVYDLTVAGTHRFYVGKHQVLVHNCGAAQIGGQAGEFSNDELAQLVYQHVGAGDIAGRPLLDEISNTLDTVGTRLAGQNAVQFESEGVRVIINEDLPWLSTAYYLNK